MKNRSGSSVLSISGFPAFRFKFAFALLQQSFPLQSGLGISLDASKFERDINPTGLKKLQG